MSESLTRYDYLPFSKDIADNFCAIPFTQLVFTPSGRVAPCCFLQDYYLGDIQTRSIDEIWNGDEIKSLRREFLSGKIHTCKMLQKHKQCHRLHERLLPYVELSDESSSKPVRLDLRLNGQCNLSCIMCETWRGANNIYDVNDFPHKFETQLLPYAKEINLLGGEPFIQRSTFEILDLAIRINPNCLWAFSTNLNIDIDKVMTYLNKIRLSRIQVSIDSLNDTIYERIRKGGSLQSVLNNLKIIIQFQEDYKKQKNENFRLQAAMCIQKENWKEIPHFINFCKTNNLNINLQFAYTPFSVSLALLDREEKDQIIAYLLDHCEDEDSIYIKPILAALADEASALQWEE